MTYRVRGSAEAKLDKVAPAVDRVMVDQVQRLAAFVDAGAAEGAKAQSLERRTYEASGARLPFVEMGSTGDPVILLHDAGSTIDRQWIETGVMRTAATQFRVIAAEARGPEDVVKLLDQLQLARAHVAGYGEGAQLAAKFAVTHPARVQTLTLAGSTSLRAAAAPGARGDLVVADADMIALTVPTLGIVGTKDPAMRDFIELKAVMPRFVRMIAIADATHEAAPASPDFAVALMYFMRYHPIAP
jgi:pimeloyl-ACP methyl ester carboxylesterase